ncbi:MAG: glycosyltransferase [Bowdeniella nasicola]|nr:glycosyltransferase [Bowdeniella nasicola]
MPVAPLGGVARHVLDVATAGIPGFRLVVVCPPGALAEELRDRGAAVVTAPIGPEAGVLTSIRSVRRIVTRLNPAVVHSHLAYADVVAAAALVTRPQVMLVSTEHGIAADQRTYHRSALGAGAKRALHRIRLARTDRLIAVSESTRRVMRETWGPRRAIHVIPNRVNGQSLRRDVDARRRQRGERRRSLGEGLRILTLSRLAPEKRLEALLRALPGILALDPTAQLTIAGEGPERHALQALARELGIERHVHWPGYVPAPEALASHDVLVQLSVWENLSYALLDAVAAGVPVLATDVGGNAEILGEACLISDVEPATIQAGVERVTRMPVPEPGEDGVTDMCAAIAALYRGQPLDGKRRLWPAIDLAVNQGEFGGGEIMALAIADALHAAGYPVRIVAPAEPSAVAQQARRSGHRVAVLAARNRTSYLAALRRHVRRSAADLTWCNGLLPAVATAGYANRIVHYHQLPKAAHRGLYGLSRGRARAALVPSEWMAHKLSGTRVLENWCHPIETAELGRRRAISGQVTLGFIGRLSYDKGLDVLLRALERLNAEGNRSYRLLIAGEPRFVGPDERAAVEARVRSAGDVVELLGWVDAEHVLADVDIVVSPSIAPESFGLVALEAMSARVPVIVSDAGALPEVVGPDAPAVVEAGSVDSLVEAIRDLALGRVPTRTAALHERWRRHYSPEAGEGRVATLIAELTEGRDYP